MRKVNLHDNRKMYCKTLKGYIRLLDIAQAIKDGEEVLVTNSLGQDVTANVIAQAAVKHAIVPTDVWVDLIRSFFEEENAPTISFPKENNYDRL